MEFPKPSPNDIEADENSIAEVELALRICGAGAGQRKAGEMNCSTGETRGDWNGEWNGDWNGDWNGELNTLWELSIC